MSGFGFGGKIEKNWFYGMGGKYLSYAITAGTSNSCSILRPSNVIAGNLLLLFLTREKGSIGSPTNWTTVSSGVHWNNNKGYSYIGYKRAMASEPSSYSFSASGGIIVNFTSLKQLYSVSPFVKTTSTTPLNLYEAMGEQSLFFVASRNSCVITAAKKEIGYQYNIPNSRFTYGFYLNPETAPNSMTRSVTSNEFVGVSLGLV